MSEVIDRLQSIRQHPVVRNGSTVVWILFVIPFMVYSFPMAVGAEHSFIVLSGSMEPTISAGDVVIVNEVAPSNIEEGDIITFRRSGDEVPTTHRVIGVEGSGDQLQFTTKGDANEDPDTSPVAADQVVGRVMHADVPVLGTLLFVIPYMGYVIQALGTTYGFIFLFVIPFVLLLGAEIRSFVRDSSDEDEADATDEGTAAGTGEATSTPGPGVTHAQPAGEAASAPSGDTDAGSDADAEDDPGTYTFTMSELRLALLVLGAFLIYSLVVANELRNLWSIMVSAGVAMTALLIGSVYIFADPVEEDDQAANEPAGTAAGAGPTPNAGTDGATDRFVSGEIPPADELERAVNVDSVQELVDIAVTDGQWIVRDGETYAVFRDDVTYVSRADPGDTQTDPDPPPDVGSATAEESSDSMWADPADGDPDRDGADPDSETEVSESDDA